MEFHRVKDKERSEVRRSMVTRKQRNGDEGEMGEGNLGKTQRWVSVVGNGKIWGRSREDP